MEAEFVEWLRRRVPSYESVSIGIGDDAAVYQADGVGTSHVVASDLLCDGIHFLSSEASYERIGRKSLAVNLSDFAAMACVPRWAIVSLLWPHGQPWRDACRLYEGLLELADEFKVALIGGDTNRWHGGLAVSVTVIGQPGPGGVLKRSGARAGDSILVTGPLGGSLLGGHLDFVPRVRESLELMERFTLGAGMDISDGLLIDLQRLTAESGVGAQLELDQIPISDAARRRAESAGPKDAASSVDRVSVDELALQHALTDGEDFELLITAAPEVAEAILQTRIEGLRISRIGKVIPTLGIFEVLDGQQKPMRVEGYLH